MPPLIASLDRQLHLLEDKCANYIEGTQDHPDSPPLDELEIAARKIHDACLSLLDAIECCVIDEERSSSSASIESEPFRSPDSAPRRLSFPLSPLDPLKRSVASLCHTTVYFNPLVKPLERHSPKELFLSSKETVALLRNTRAELRGFDSSKLGFCTHSSKGSEAAASAAFDPTEPSYRESFTLPKARVAICDDIGACRRILNKMVTPFASNVTATLDSISTLRAFLTTHGDEIDLLFLDNELGDGTGWNFIEEMRAHPSWSQIFVVLITSTATFNLPDPSDSTKMSWLVRGFDAFLGKPTSPTEIKEALSENYQRVKSSLEPRNWIKS